MKNDLLINKVKLWLHLYSEELTQFLVLIVLGIIVFQIKMLPINFRNSSLNKLDSESFALFLR